MWQLNGRVLAVLTIALAGLTGCAAQPGAKTQPFAITVNVDDSLVKTQQVEVDVIAVSDAEKPRWDGIAVNDYFKPDCALRQSPDLIAWQFNDSNPTRTLAIDDPHWGLWKSRPTMWLFLIAYVPSVNGNGAGEADPRRQEISIDAYHWRSAGGTKELKFQVGTNGITCLTQMPPSD